MPAELIAIVLRELKKQADRYCGHDVRRAVLGHPVFFAVGAEGKGWEDRQLLAMRRLEEAARLAGFDELVLADEALVAVAQEQRTEGILVGLDFGGGTFDVSVVEQTKRYSKLLSTQGAGIGGERFDALLFDHVLSGPLGLDATYFNHGKTLAVPRRMREMGTLYGMLTMVGDPDVRRIVENFLSYGGGHRLQTVDELLYGGHGYTFYRTVEGAKIALSEVEEAGISFSRPGIDIDEPVTRKEFTALISADLDRLDEVIGRALADAGVRVGTSRPSSAQAARPRSRPWCPASSAASTPTGSLAVMRWRPLPWGLASLRSTSSA